MMCVWCGGAVNIQALLQRLQITHGHVMYAHSPVKSVCCRELQSLGHIHNRQRRHLEGRVITFLEAKIFGGLFWRAFFFFFFFFFF